MTPLAGRVASRLASLLEGSSWPALRLGCDLVVLIAGCIGGLILSDAPESAWLLGFPPLALLLLHARGRYEVGNRDLVLDNVAPGFGAISIAAMTVFTSQMLLAGGRESISSLMAWTWCASLGGVTLVGLLLPMARNAARRRGLVGSAALIVGTDDTAMDIALRLERRPEYGLRLVGFLDDEPTGISDSMAPTLGGLNDIERVAAEHDIRTVVIAYPKTTSDVMTRFVSRCDRLRMQTNVVTRFSSAVNYQTRFEYLGTVPLLNLRATNPESWSFAVKHALDRVIAGLLLIALSPLLALTAAAVRLSSPGPIVFRQLRAGRDGRTFELLKFRTMLATTSEPPRVKLGPGIAPGGVEGVDRRTRFGRLLRATSFDELPQLVNVLRGEMSIVGPRPERPELAELFERDISRYQDRHRVRCGITGWAQVNGHRGQTQLLDRVECDNFYIEHWSLTLDLKIMLLTIPALLRGS